MRWSFAERENFSEGSSEPKGDAQVIRVQGAAAQPVILTRITCSFSLFLFSLQAGSLPYIDIHITSTPG